MSDSVEQPARIRILVLEDQPLLRHGISACLNSQPDMMVCGEAESLLSARSNIAQCALCFLGRARHSCTRPVAVALLATRTLRTAKRLQEMLFQRVLNRSGIVEQYPFDD